jgi:hypothetical protein
MLILLCASVAWGEKAPDTRHLLKRVKGGSLSTRMEKFSAAFLGQPFGDAPLGEGETGKYDRNPLYRTDRFDCTTFIETVLALALSKTQAEFEKKLTRIRYADGKISFTRRNHFPCADWIPHNTEAGFIVDITAQVAGPLGVETATAKIDKKGWYENLKADAIQIPGLSDTVKSALLNELHAEGAAFPPETASIPYIPLSKLITRKAPTDEEIKARKADEEALEAKLRAEPVTTDPAKHEAHIHAEIVNHRLAYVDKDAVVDETFLKTVPSGIILNVVRPNFKIPGTHLNVSHQGLIIRRKDVAYFRHVSKTGGERVKDVPLSNYLRLCLLSPPIKGINLLQPTDSR